uniref:Ig-like domain-containing protein n=1 Tax=Pygocentrus nattereri TaxID=42514 RepID=A0AAR2ITC0_PYGNA
MECTYTPPSGHSVQKAFWTKELVTSGSEPPDLSDDPEYRGRVLFLGDEHHDCTLRFKTVTEKDQSKYYFTFITDKPGGKYQGAGGVDLSVTDLQVEVPERVIEGDEVTLTCKTTCSLTVRPTFTWYRNGRYLSSSTDQLHLQSVSSDNKDRYHCAVLGLRSPVVTLNVRYGPKSVSVSFMPSGETVDGALLNLTCSSDGNPPVQNYTWFKEGGRSPVGSGHSYRALQSGSYYCVALNEHGSQKSAAVTVSDKGIMAKRTLMSPKHFITLYNIFLKSFTFLCTQGSRRQYF